MIVREFYEVRSDGVRLFKTYSDSGFYIKQNESGNIYSEAVDVENAPFTYSETDELIETDKDIEI